MAFQSTTVIPGVTTPAQDINKIVNDLAQLRLVIGGGTDTDIPMLPAANTIRTVAIQDLAVTTAKLADAAITPAKLSAGKPTWDSAGNVTLGSGTGNSHTVNGQLTATGGLLQTSSGGEAQVMASRTGTGASSFYLYNNGTQQGLYDSGQQALISALKTGEVGISAGSGTRTTAFYIDANRNFSRVIPGGTTLYPDFACRAWATFNSGTGSINAAGNVSSITRTSLGNYTVNFATAMPDTNYKVIGNVGTETGGALNYIALSAVGTTQVLLKGFSSAGAALDPVGAGFAIIR